MCLCKCQSSLGKSFNFLVERILYTAFHSEKWIFTCTSKVPSNRGGWRSSTAEKRYPQAVPLDTPGSSSTPHATHQSSEPEVSINS